MNVLTNYLDPLARALYWALCCSVAQAAPATCLLWLALKAFPHLRPSHKYVLAYASLMGLFAWFLATFVAAFRLLAPVSMLTVRTAIPANVATSFPPVQPIMAPGLPATTLVISWQALLLQFQGYVLPVYLTGLTLMSLRLMAGMTRVYQFKNKGLTPLPQPWDALFDKCQRQMGVYRTVAVYLSEKVNSPLMLGALKPVILLPLSLLTQLSADQVEAILLHELAHIRRHDYLLNLVQVVVETILFFNPFVWLLSRAIRNLREECCDDRVLAVTRQPLPYAHALAALEALQAPQLLSLAATGNKNQLFHRIKRITTMKRNQFATNPWHVTALMLLLVCGLAVMVPVRNLMAQKVRQNKNDTHIKNSADDNWVTFSFELNNHAYSEWHFIANDIHQHENDKDPVFLEQLKRTDTTNVSFILSTGDKFNINLFDDPLRIHRIIKGQRSISSGKDINYSELHAKYRESFSKAYQKIMSPALSRLLDEKIDMEISLARNRKNFSRRLDSTCKIQSQYIVLGIQALAKNGLLDTTHSYTILKGNSEVLKINGKEQALAVNKKYSAYFPENWSCTLTRQD